MAMPGLLLNFFNHINFGNVIFSYISKNISSRCKFNGATLHAVQYQFRLHWTIDGNVVLFQSFFWSFWHVFYDVLSVRSSYFARSWNRLVSPGHRVQHFSSLLRKLRRRNILVHDRWWWSLTNGGSSLNKEWNGLGTLALTEHNGRNLGYGWNPVTSHALDWQPWWGPQSKKKTLHYVKEGTSE